MEKSVLVAYMPWEGYNYEDAVLISERLVYEDIYTSFHIRKYEIQTHVTNQGPERVTKEIPHLEAHLLIMKLLIESRENAAKYLEGCF